jgi:DNA-binding XRE family transcriptional regulator
MTTKSHTSERKTTRNAVSDLLIENIKLYVAVRNVYDQCDQEIKEVVDLMVGICNDPESTEDERIRAIHTITDAIFPSESVDVLDACGSLAKHDPKGRNAVMIEEEKTFAQRLSDAMDAMGMTQDELASTIGVSQPAISNMLKRQCRPQRKTVAKIASALGVEPADLWPSNG